MPVDDLHRCYTERLPQWMRCRDACEGEDVVKSKGMTYLPRLSNQKDLEYDAYKRRAAWYGATARTVWGLAGSVMRKSPAVLAPEVLATHLDDVTETSVSLTTFASILVQEVLTVGRVGILLDMPEGTPEGMPRPQWVEYRTEQICNWKTEMLGGVRTLTMVVLSEEYEEPGADGFRSECRTQYRVLRLVEGRYVVEIWRSDQKRRSEYVLAKSIMPVVRGVSLPYLPFVFVNALHIDADPSKPPLLDLVDLNFKHYLNSADLEHGRHFTALPTPYVTGMAKDKQGSLQIGRAQPGAFRRRTPRSAC